jgi:hypothetical protein
VAATRFFLNPEPRAPNPTPRLHTHRKSLTTVAVFDHRAWDLRSASPATCAGPIGPAAHAKTCFRQLDVVMGELHRAGERPQAADRRSIHPGRFRDRGGKRRSAPARRLNTARLSCACCAARIRPPPAWLAPGQSQARARTDRGTPAERNYDERGHASRRVGEPHRLSGRAEHRLIGLAPRAGGRAFSSHRRPRTGSISLGDDKSPTVMRPPASPPPS